MFTEARSRLGWRTGASRVAMKEQLEQLQSFDPTERARGGEQLVGLGLNRCADALLDHVANEFDTQVIATIAHAVLRTPADSKESRKAQELRAWAAAEVERSALEESFMGEAPGPAGYRFELPPEDDATGLDPERQPLPARVPVAVVAGEAGAVEYRFDLPPETEPVEWDTDTAFEAVEYHSAPVEAAPAPPATAEPYEADAPPAQYQAEPAPAYEPAAEPPYTIDPQPAYGDDMPAPIGAPDPQPSVPTEAPTYIYWRPPADDGAHVESPAGIVPDTSPAGVGEPVDPSWPGIEIPTLEPLGVDEPAPGEFRFAGPEPLAPAAKEAPATSPDFEPAPAETPAANPFPEYRFEPPDSDAAPAAAPVEQPDDPAEEAGPPRTLAERLRARNV